MEGHCMLVSDYFAEVPDLAEHLWARRGMAAAEEEEEDV